MLKRIQKEGQTLYKPAEELHNPVKRRRLNAVPSEATGYTEQPRWVGTDHRNIFFMPPVYDEAKERKLQKP